MNENLKQWLSDYKEGKEVETVEMGGISIGYENAIQHLAYCALTTLSEIKAPEDDNQFTHLINTTIDKWVHKLNDQHGFSGAQVGAAKNLTAIFYRKTPDVGLQMMRDSDPGRIIKMTKNGVITLQKETN
jgi:hypothetical protein